jgi:hypothetical protein
LLEIGDLFIRESISLGNDRDEVDFGMESSHHLNIEGLQGMPSWLNEVYTGVYTVVHDVHSVDLVLSLEVRVESLLNVLHNWSPRIVVVHEITKARGVYNSQSQSDSVLLNISTD